MVRRKAIHADKTSFEEFWPFYVCEHSKPATRLLHFLGTGSLLPCILAALWFNPYWLLAYPVCAYGLAWFSHFAIEKNRPATFTSPVLSLIGDYKMFWYMLCGKMNHEAKRCQELKR